MNYRKVLKHDRKNPEALNLLGVISLQTGDSKKAIKLIRKALEQDNINPGYLNNLGQALHASDDLIKAVTCYQKALDIQPNNTDYLNNLGISLNVLGRYDEAEPVFRKALLLNNQDPKVFHNQGISFQDAGKSVAAIESYRSALSMNPNLPTTLASLASALEEVGQRELAVQSYLNAIRLDPLYVAAHEGLQNIRWISNEHDRLHETYQYACEKLPNSADAFYNLARSLSNSNEIELAFDAVEKSLDLDNNHSGSLRVMATLHRAQKNFVLAIEAHKKTLELDRKNVLNLESYGYTLSVAGFFDQAVSELMRAHKMHPRRSSILGGLTVAMNEVLDPKVDDLVDYATYVTTRSIEVPEGFNDLGEFNEALHEEISARHEERPPPKDQSMRGGTQIPNHLFNGATGLTDVVKKQIINALDTYIHSLKDDPTHPYLRYINPNYRFTGAWSTILYGSGYDGSHIHNDGWLSGVYYIKVPNIPEEVWARGEGCIQFGEPPTEFVTSKNQSQKLIRPRVGTTVFFPSYYWHGVQPFNQEGVRHSISFDII